MRGGGDGEEVGRRWGWEGGVREQRWGGGMQEECELWEVGEEKR